MRFRKKQIRVRSGTSHRHAPALVKATVGSGTAYALRGEVYNTEGTFYAVLLGDEFVYIHKDDMTVSTAPMSSLWKSKSAGTDSGAGQPYL